MRASSWMVGCALANSQAHKLLSADAKRTEQALVQPMRVNIFQMTFKSTAVAHHPIAANLHSGEPRSSFSCSRIEHLLFHLAPHPGAIVWFSISLLCVTSPSSPQASERQVTTEEAEAFAKEREMLFIEASALDGRNVDQAFEELILKALERRDARQGPQQPSRGENLVAPADGDGGQQSAGCC